MEKMIGEILILTIVVLTLILLCVIGKEKELK